MKKLLFLPHEFEKAEKLACEAHKDQKDKSGADYIGHPLRVSARCNSTKTKITGLLHDTIEDTYVTPQLLRIRKYLHSWRYLKGLENNTGLICD